MSEEKGGLNGLAGKGMWRGRERWVGSSSEAVAVGGRIEYLHYKLRTQRTLRWEKKAIPSEDTFPATLG